MVEGLGCTVWDVRVHGARFRVSCQHLTSSLTIITITGTYIRNRLWNLELTRTQTLKLKYSATMYKTSILSSLPGHGSITTAGKQSLYEISLLLSLS